MKSRLTRPLFRLPLLLLCGGCAWLGLGSAPRSPVALLGAADAALPEVAFAKLLEYPGARLFDYMDGAAEAYYARNFRVLGTADAKWRDTEAVIELYRVAAPADAQALFDDHNDGKGRELPAGIASAAWEAKELEGIFHRGPYFCRFIIYGNDPEAHQLLDTLAAAVDQAIAE